MSRATTPSAGFNSKLQDLFRAGTKAIVRIPCGTRQNAIKWRSAMHKLRLAMRKENHPDWELMYGAEVTIDKHDPSVLVVGPRNFQFAEAIYNTLGREYNAPPEIEIDDSFLKSLKEVKENP